MTNENELDSEAEFQQFSTASQRLETWLTEWRDCLRDFKFDEAQHIGHRTETTERTWELLKSIDDGLNAVEDTISLWQDRIIAADPVGSAGTTFVDRTSDNTSELTPDHYWGHNPTAHGAAVVYLQTVQFWFLDLIELSRASGNDTVPADEFKKWMTSMRPPTNSDFVSRSIRERAYVRERFGPPEEEYSAYFNVGWWERELKEPATTFRRNRIDGKYRFKKSGQRIAIRMKDLSEFSMELRDKVKAK